MSGSPHNSSGSSDSSDRSGKSISRLSDCSFTSEKSVTIEVDDSIHVEVKEAGVQTNFDNGIHTDLDACGVGREEYVPLPRIDWQEKLQQARAYKLAGNEKYKAKEYRQAIGQYHRALIYIRAIRDAMQAMPVMPESGECQVLPQMTEDVLSEVKQLQLDCYNNLAASIIRSPNPMYKKVCHYCDLVLKESPENTFALFRKGLALYKMNQPDVALPFLEKASQNPRDIEEKINRYLKACRSAVSSAEKRMCQSMMQSLTLEEDEDVFTENVQHPDLVQPRRKETKASSVA